MHQSRSADHAGKYSRRSVAGQKLPRWRARNASSRARFEKFQQFSQSIFAFLFNNQIILNFSKSIIALLPLSDCAIFAASQLPVTAIDAQLARVRTRHYGGDTVGG